MYDIEHPHQYGIEEDIPGPETEFQVISMGECNSIHSVHIPHHLHPVPPEEIPYPQIVIPCQINHGHLPCHMENPIQNAPVMGVDVMPVLEPEVEYVPQEDEFAPLPLHHIEELDE